MMDHRLPLLALILLLPAAAADPRKLALVKQQPLVLRYHSGPLLKGNLTLRLIWYGHFSASQRAVIADFVRSLSTAPPSSVASWWATTSLYRGGEVNVSLGTQITHDSYSLGKLLKLSDIIALARSSSRGSPHSSAVTVTAVLTSPDVAVDGFCVSRCGLHRSFLDRGEKFAYIWVGNPVSQCPGQCAWPFHQPIFGPQTPPLLPPSGDVGVDGMVINLATLLAGTVTNPDGRGYFQGTASAPMEAVSACTGMFGPGSYPGYPGQLLTDAATGASYNAVGVDGRKYLLPAMWDPLTSQCKTNV